jgi:hypothetical protein
MIMTVNTPSTTLARLEATGSVTGHDSSDGEEVLEAEKTRGQRDQYPQQGNGAEWISDADASRVDLTT